MTHERDLEWCAWSRFESRERETESRYIEILYLGSLHREREKLARAAAGQPPAPRAGRWTRDARLRL
jgi:hypothetical protein